MTAKIEYDKKVNEGLPQKTLNLSQIIQYIFNIDGIIVF